MNPFENEIPNTQKCKPELTSATDYETIKEMLADAIDDKAEDYAKYLYVAEAVGNGEEAELIKTVAYNDYKNQRLFEEIYKALTGETPEPPPVQPRNFDSDLGRIIHDGFFEKLEQIEMFREIMAAFENNCIRDILFEIISDDRSHAMIFNYILTKNR